MLFLIWATSASSATRPIAVIALAIARCACEISRSMDRLSLFSFPPSLLNHRSLLTIGTTSFSQFSGRLYSSNFVFWKLSFSTLLNLPLMINARPSLTFGPTFSSSFWSFSISVDSCSRSIAPASTFSTFLGFYPQ